MSGTIEQINKLSAERAKLFREASNGRRGDPETLTRIHLLDGELKRLWDLRRHELAGRKHGIEGLIDHEYERLYGRDEERKLSWRELAEAASAAA